MCILRDESYIIIISYIDECTSEHMRSLVGNNVSSSV